VRGVRLADVSDSRDNNFDVLRLFAASIVLVSHSFVLAGGEDPFDVTGLTLGSLGVALFFGMSGFLIMKSWSYEPVVGDFFRKRALRILPALWVALLLTAFVLGPLVTERSIGSYLGTGGTWRYLVPGLFLVTFGGVLPGVFTHLPYPNAVNGSLWTLPIEASAYIGVALAGRLGLLRRQFLLGAFAVLLAVAFVWQDDATLGNLRLYGFFIAGMLLYAFRGQIVLSWWMAGGALALWAATFTSPLLVVSSAVLLPYVVLVIAYRSTPKLRVLVAQGDVSYGLYIYAFPIQQLVAWALGDSVSTVWILVISLPVAWLLGLASWKLVERPALKRKPKRRLARRLPSSSAPSSVPAGDA
jgi:peptidoglycan/LPS O-acetylase OafA/YrhL